MLIQSINCPTSPTSGRVEQNKSQQGHPEKQAPRINKLIVLFSDVHPLGKPNSLFFHFRDQLSLSQTNHYYFDLHEQILKSKLNQSGIAELNQSSFSAKVLFLTMPMHRNAEETLIDSKGIELTQEQLPIGCGPVILWNLKHGKLGIEDAENQLNVRRKTIHGQLKQQFGFLVPRSFNALQKYILDGSLSADELNQLPQNEVTQFAAMLADVQRQKLIDLTALNQELQQPLIHFKEFVFVLNGFMEIHDHSLRLASCLYPLGADKLQHIANHLEQDHVRYYLWLTFQTTETLPTAEKLYAIICFLNEPHVKTYLDNSEKPEAWLKLLLDEATTAAGIAALANPIIWQQAEGAFFMSESVTKQQVLWLNEESATLLCKEKVLGYMKSDDITLRQFLGLPTTGKKLAGHSAMHLLIDTTKTAFNELMQSTEAGRRVLLNHFEEPKREISVGTVPIGLVLQSTEDEAALFHHGQYADYFKSLKNRLAGQSEVCAVQ